MTMRIYNVFLLIALIKNYHQIYCICSDITNIQLYTWHRSFNNQCAISKMKIFYFVTLFTLLHTSFAYQVIKELRKQINDGEILGRYITSESGRTVSAFIGIPFAAPPVGNLRFQAPQKVMPWNGTLLTQNQRAKCPQIDTMIGSTVVEGQEDCLYVNVYVPDIRANRKIDVLVWIHGGVLYFINKNSLM